MSRENHRKQVLVRVPSPHGNDSDSSSSADPLSNEGPVNPYLYIPNTNRLPTILPRPVDASPSYHRDSIISRELSGNGIFHYLLQTKIGDTITQVKRVAPEHVLNYVSAAELETFENDYVKNERREEEEQHRAERLLAEQTPRRKVIPTSIESRFDSLTVGQSSQVGRPVRTGEIQRKRRTQVELLEKASEERLSKKNKADLAIYEEKTPDPIGSTSASVSEEEEFELERIVGDAVVDGIPMYLIKWVGYSEEENTWQTEESLLENASDLVREYMKAKTNNNYIGAIRNEEAETSVRQLPSIGPGLDDNSPLEM